MSGITLADYMFLQNYLQGEPYAPSLTSFQRPNDATAYLAPSATAPGGLIGQSKSSASACVPLNFALLPITTGDAPLQGKLSYVQLWDTSASYKTIRIHILKATTAPTVTSVDNAAIALATSLTRDTYLGFTDVALEPGPFGGSYGQSDLYRVPYSLASGESLWTFHEARTTFTPGAQSTFYELLTFDRRR